jgi:hypothetical protein
MSPEPLEWIAPEPRALPAMREELADRMRNPFLALQVSMLLKNGRGTVNPISEDPDASAAFLLSEERRRLMSASLYSISSEMTQVAISAGRKLPSWEVRPEDIPSESGLMVFDEPIAYYEMDDPVEEPKVVSIIGVSWGSTEAVEEPDEHVWVTFWSLHHTEIGVRSLRKLGISFREARELQGQLGTYGWDNEALLRFNSPNVLTSDGKIVHNVDPSDGNITTATSAPWVQTVRAAWLLMKRDTRKPVADVEDLPLSRTVRRRLEREGYDTDPVHVVTLHQRHQARSDADHASGYKVKKRSHVIGHVRWQPYRSRGVIEPIWIEDHVRGPEGAPFSVKKTTVSVLDRPPGGRPPVKGQ